MGNTKMIEKGEFYLFYRSMMDVDTPGNLDDIARLHLILMPEGGSKGRMFVVGKKRLPEILKGNAKSGTREWMMNTAVATPKKLGEALGPIEYGTKTRGRRHEKAAVPAAEGGYVIVRRNSHTELAYSLKRPERRGKAQKELGILREASYVISAKNPDVEASGFPDEKPDYPKKLKQLFAEKRWIDVSDPKLLDYENAQFLLIGARDDLRSYDVMIPQRANLFKTLELDEKDWPTQALEKGSFATADHDLEAKKPEKSRTKGGERGGKAAAKTDSAAGIAKALKGIDFPKSKKELEAYANDHAPDEIMEIIGRFRSKTYRDMSDVAKEAGEVTPADSSE